MTRGTLDSGCQCCNCDYHRDCRLRPDDTINHRLRYASCLLRPSHRTFATLLRSGRRNSAPCNFYLCSTVAVGFRLGWPWSVKSYYRCAIFNSPLQIPLPTTVSFPRAKRLSYSSGSQRSDSFLTLPLFCPSAPILLSFIPTTYLSEGCPGSTHFWFTVLFLTDIPLFGSFGSFASLISQSSP